MKNNNWWSIACIITLVIIAIIVSLGVGMTIEKRDMVNRLYPNVAYVVEIDRATDTLTVEDSIGHLWSVQGVEDYMLGDLVGMVMDSMGTDLVYDDEVVKMHYCGGWTEG